MAVSNLAQIGPANTDYFLGDALGSTRQMADTAGNITQSQSYDPFGNNIGAMGDESSILGFAGEQTDATGYQFLRARYYDPGTGRFLSQDTFPGYLDQSQSQNPYVYGLNNPVLYLDPSGKCVFTPFDFAFCMGAIIGGSIDLFTQLHHNGGDLNCINWGEVAISAGAGGVAGLVGLVSFEVLLPAAGATLADYIIAGTLSGALTGQYARLTTYALSGQYERIGNIGTDMFNPKDMFIDAVLGGVFSAAGYGLEQILGNLASFSARNVSEDGNAMEDTSSGQSSDSGLADTNCANSFTADTPVDTSKGETPISDVKAGDYVLAYNEENNTTGWYPVTDTIKHEDKTIVHLVLDNEKITTTPEHPFYTKEKGWVNAIDLKTDMHVRKADGSYGAVKSVTTEDAPREMYNLTVDTAHTYFVGNGKWLVHNMCPSGRQFNIPSDKVGQVARRGWTDSDIADTIENPVLIRTDPNIVNRANGNPVTYYYRADGHYVVIDDFTGTVVQVSNTYDPRWIDEMTDNPIHPIIR